LHTVSLDDFFYDTNRLLAVSKSENGEQIDYDSPKTIDTAALRTFVTEIFDNDRSHCPIFDFTVGKRIGFREFLCTDDDFKYTDEELETVSAEDITKMLFDRAMAIYRAKEEKYGSETMREIERVILLSSVDSHWEDHIDAMDDLKSSVGLNAYAQRNPVNEYKIEGADMFDEMIVNIREKTVRNILSFSLQRVESIQREQSSRATNEGFVGDESKAAPKKPVVNKQNKVAPNDPCPCGSGLKYKKCCGLKD
jgi:preprotein translocase subunit SecA